MSVMDEALQIKNVRGTLAAADFLCGKGFDYDFSMIALVGLRNANLHYGIEFKNLSSEKRGRQRARVLNLVSDRADA